MDTKKRDTVKSLLGFGGAATVVGAGAGYMVDKLTDGAALSPNPERDRELVSGTKEQLRNAELPKLPADVKKMITFATDNLRYFPNGLTAPEKAAKESFNKSLGITAEQASLVVGEFPQPTVIDYDPDTNQLNLSLTVNGNSVRLGLRSIEDVEGKKTVGVLLYNEVNTSEGEKDLGFFTVFDPESGIASMYYDRASEGPNTYVSVGMFNSDVTQISEKQITESIKYMDTLPLEVVKATKSFLLTE